MSLNSLYKAPEATGENITLSNTIRVPFTVSNIERIAKTYAYQVEHIATLVKRPTVKETAIAIWKFLREELKIKYSLDKIINAKGEEEVIERLRRPARLLQDKEGDCDCYTIFILSVLLNIYKNNPAVKLGIRVVAYDAPRDWQHVYPVIFHEGNTYAIDVVPEIHYPLMELSFIDNKDTIMTQELGNATSPQTTVKMLENLGIRINVETESVNQKELIEKVLIRSLEETQRQLLQNPDDQDKLEAGYIEGVLLVWNTEDRNEAIKLAYVHSKRLKELWQIVDYYATALKNMPNKTVNGLTALSGAETFVLQGYEFNLEDIEDLGSADDDEIAFELNGFDDDIEDLGNADDDENENDLGEGDEDESYSTHLSGALAGALGVGVTDALNIASSVFSKIKERREQNAPVRAERAKYKAMIKSAGSRKEKKNLRKEFKQKKREIKADILTQKAEQVKTTTQTATTENPATDPTVTTQKQTVVEQVKEEVTDPVKTDPVKDPVKDDKPKDPKDPKTENKNFWQKIPKWGKIVIIVILALTLVGGLYLIFKPKKTLNGAKKRKYKKVTRRKPLAGVRKPKTKYQKNPPKKRKNVPKRKKKK
ncbi:MAG: hypothetical protein MUC49_14800 [Raineya sp.]|jgi:hypothetical protein|nr:hypothetical protein [Raineya sp.]